MLALPRFRRPPATSPLAALVVALALGASCARDALATPAWFSPVQPRYSWYFDHAAVTADTRRGRALAFGGTLTSLGHGGVTYQSNTDSVFVFGFEPALRMRGMPVTGGGPAARAYAGFAYDSLADRAWLFAGRALRVDQSQLQPLYFPVPLGDLWALDLSAPTGSWQLATPTGASPERRFGLGMVLDPVHRRLLVHGGRDSLGACFGDVHQLDLASDPPQWSALVPTGAAPTPRWRHATAFDPAGQRLYLHGGASASDSLHGTWALDLSGAPRWDSVAVAPPALALSALAWDSRRGRLLGYAPNPATVFVLDSTGGGPAWVALPAAPILRGSRPQLNAHAGAAYDGAHDQLLLPYAGLVGQTFQPSLAIPWTVVFDPATAPGAPANLSPQRLTHDAWHGEVWTRWSLPSSGGQLYELPGLEREIGAGVYNPVGPPVAWYPDSAIAHYHYPDQPLQWTRWQVRWTDPLAVHTATSWYDWTPAAPIAMSCTIDSAEVVGGAMRLKWTLANDSLSRLAAPHVWRSTVLADSDLGVAWPDSSRQVRFVDADVLTGTTYTWNLRWTSHAGADTTGAVTRTIGAPIPARVERRQPGVGAYVRWSVPGVAPFRATAYRRSSADGAWSAFDTLEADANRDLVLYERGLPLDSHVEYRLGWMDAGAEAFTAREVFDVPPFTAAIETLLVGTRRTRIVWSVWPYDSSLTVRTHHGADGFVAERLAEPGVPRAVHEDSLTWYGWPEYFWVSVQQGGTYASAGPTDFVRPAPPAPVSAALTTGNAVAQWRGSEAADGYQLWRAVDDGAYALADTPPRGAATILWVEPMPAGVDSLRFQLRWHEWDGVWRATRDTTVYAGGAPPPTAASFALVGAQPASGSPAFRYALPDARPATIALLDLLGRECWSTRIMGSGVVTAPAGLRAGVYWVRFAHPGLTRTHKVVVLR